MNSNDDKRMKDLADRLVGMSPEPPPFPEEVNVTQPAKSKPSPVLMFAGAAAIVLLIAAIPILLFSRGGGEVVASTTTSTVPATATTQEPGTSTTQAPVTTTVPDTTTTEAVPQEGAIIFLVQQPENSFTGNPAVVPFFSMGDAYPGDPELAALRLLTDDMLTPPEGFTTSVPIPVSVVDVEVDAEDHRITIDMNDAFLEGSGTGLLGDFTMLNQLIFTSTSEGGISEVMFTVNDAPVTQFGTEGLDLTEPVGRDSFLDQLNSVIVDSAITVEAGAPLNVTGFANVFEATVSLQLVDDGGSVVYEDFTTASCGTGCWGAYSFHIEGVDFESAPLTLKVFWNSPEDGAPSDVVSIPVEFGAVSLRG